MGEIKAQLLGIAAVVVTFGIIASALFLAFDTAANNLAKDITAEVEYKESQSSSNIIYNGYIANINNEQLLSF